MVAIPLKWGDNKWLIIWYFRPQQKKAFPGPLDVLAGRSNFGASCFQVPFLVRSQSEIIGFYAEISRCESGRLGHCFSLSDFTQLLKMCHAIKNTFSAGSELLNLELLDLKYWLLNLIDHYFWWNMINVGCLIVIPPLFLFFLGVNFPIIIFGNL